MSDINLLNPIILKWEGKYVNDPDDKGGATNMGVTIGTWRQVGYDKDEDDDIDGDDVKLLTKEDFNRVLRLYWDRWQADYIHNQSVANILVDWVWGSGAWGIKIPQRLLGVNDDGKVGQKTLKAVNNSDYADLFDEIYRARVKFIEDLITVKPKQRKFKKGWLNRLKDFKYSP